MNSNFSWKTTIVTGFLVIGMFGMAIWQWNRHLWKIGVIARLTANLEVPPVLLNEIPAMSSEIAWTPYFYRRVNVSGEFDFEHEVIVRNRRLGNLAGFHIITPLRIAGNNRSILINRGFLPLGTEAPGERKKYQSVSEVSLTVLLKEATSPRLFSPQDGDTGLGKPWVDSWLRVDVAKMQLQLPYPILPVYAELIGAQGAADLTKEIVKESEAGRNEILLYTSDRKVKNQGLAGASNTYPLPAHDTTPPPDIHLGYVWEWSFMALLTGAIGIILQLPRPTRFRTGQKLPNTLN